MLIETTEVRVLTDPAFDPEGTEYDFGPALAPRAWFASTKTYRTPCAPSELGPIDAVLLSHDHHADNLDHEGRRLLATDQVRRVITTVASARRLSRAARSSSTAPGDGLGISDKLTSLAPRESTTLGSWSIRATPARHGPSGLPQVHEVTGFLLEAQGAPSVWISGDTVRHSALDRFADELGARSTKIDVAIVHCGGVRFPRVPLLGSTLFTFDAEQAVDICRRIDPGVIIPIHRSGWAHFRESEQVLRDAFERAGLGDRMRWLELGATTDIG